MIGVFYKITKKFWTAIIAALLCCPSFLYALPEGESVIEGTATFDRSEVNTLKINVSSNKAIINYNSFNIGSNENVYFIQPSASSAALNRVTSLSASNIYGLLSANGIIYLVNPNGINIGPTSNIDAAGIIASTLNISNADFLAGRNNFYKDGVNAFILNQGNIVVTNGGYVALLSQAVENQGVIQANLGSVAMASGNKMTVALDDLNQISVVIDEPVKEIVLGPDGNRITSAVKNSGTITANGGKVILTAKSLNNIFDYAVNNAGVVEAKSLESHNGVIELKGEGAAIVNSGTLNAGTVNVEVKDAAFINKGEVIAPKEPAIEASGIVNIQANSLLQAGSIVADKLISVEAEDISVVLDYSPPTVEIDPVLNTSPAVIMQAPEVRVTARQFGSSDVPLNIDAALTYINRTQGDINILDSLGIGTSVLVRGPPEGFGAIVYNNDADLILETQNGNIYGAKDVFVYGENLTLKANLNIHSESILEAQESITLLAGADITSLGTLKAKYLIECGASFIVGGIYEVGLSSVQNADNAITLNTGNYTGETQDAGDIIINNNAIITLIGNTIFRADNDQNGKGNFDMRNNSSIIGGGFNLTLYASQKSTLRQISGVGTLTINESKVGSNPEYAANNENISVTNLTINSGRLNVGNISLTVSSTTSVSGTLSITNTQGTKSFGDITINNGGVFEVTNNPEEITVSGSWTNSGTFNAGTGTVTFNGTTAGKTITSGNSAFNNLTFNGAGGSWTLQDALDVDNNLTLTAGTLDVSANSRSITIGGNFNLTGGVFIARNGTVTFDSATAGKTITSGGTSFYNLTFNGAGADWTLQDALDVDNNLTLTAGTLDVSINSYSVTIGGSFTLTGGVFTARQGRVTFDSTTAGRTITSGGTSFYDMTFNGVGGGWTLQDALVVTNDLTITNGTLSAGNNSITVSGNWTNSGTFNAGTGTVTFDSATVGKTITSGNSAFNNLIFNGAGGYWTLQDALDVDNNLTLTAGTLDVSTNNYSVTIGGNFKLTGGVFTARNGTVTFDSIAAGRTITSGGTSFYDMTFNGVGGGWTLQDALDIDNNLTLTAGTLDVSANNYSISIGGNLTRTGGIFTPRQGRVTFDDRSKSSTISGSFTFFNFTSTTAGKIIIFEAGSIQAIGGAWSITGALNDFIILRSTSSGGKWNIDPQGARGISFVDVQDSNNINNNPLMASNSSNSRNNTNWYFFEELFAGQLSGGLVLRSVLPDSGYLSQFQVNIFVPTGGPVYLYHPLTPSDISAFEEIDQRRRRG